MSRTENMATEIPWELFMALNLLLNRVTIGTLSATTNKTKLSFSTNGPTKRLLLPI